MGLFRKNLKNDLFSKRTVKKVDFTGLEFFGKHKLQALIETLPSNIKREYIREYKRMKKEDTLTYFFHFFGFSYAYLGKWFKQFLFLITGGGVGIWWVINFLRIPMLVEKQNDMLALNLFSYIKRKHNLQFNLSSQKKSDVNQKPSGPRPMNIFHEPTNLKPENLKKGYLIDYKTETWLTLNENQYDYSSNEIDRVFQISNQKDTVLSLYLKNELGFQSIFVCYQINIHIFHPTLENDIITQGKPPQSLTYIQENYYRENTKTGWLFNISTKGEATGIKCWEFFNSSKTKTVRIEWINKESFKVFVGQVEDDFMFSNVLPN